jgi:hypothetical protein
VFDGYGIADISDVLDITVSGYSASPVTSSYAGGKLTVTGNDISESAIIKVGGM